MWLIARNSVLLSGLLLSSPGMATPQNTEFRFSSACDFKELTIDVRDELDDNAGYIKLNIKLQPEAITRLAQHSGKYMNQKMTLYINGVEISTATIRAVLNTANLQMVVDDQTAKKVFPSLLATQCQQADGN